MAQMPSKGEVYGEDALCCEGMSYDGEKQGIQQVWETGLGQGVRQTSCADGTRWAEHDEIQERKVRGLRMGPRSVRQAPSRSDEGIREGKRSDSVSELSSGGEFEKFWCAYPRKVGKGKARQLWARKKPDLETCLKALEWQKKTPQWNKDGGVYIPHPSTWISQERWDDEAPKEPENPKPVIVQIQTQEPTEEDFEKRRQRAREISKMLGRIGNQMPTANCYKKDIDR